MNAARALLALLALALAACAPRETAGPAAPSSGITRDLALVLARDAARTIGGTVVTFTPTGSMLPTIDSRSIGVAERLDPAEPLRLGDIVLYPAADALYAHRVIAVAPDGYALTAGDNNPRSDGWHRPALRLVALYYPAR